MAADPESFGLLGKVAAAATVVLAPVGWLWTQLGKKADKIDLDKSLKHIEKLYENAERDRALVRDLHDRAMSEIRENQSQLIVILGRKQ